MRLEITRIEGLRNDLLLRIDRAEIAAARLSVANRARLMTLPGMPRHRQPSSDEARGIAEASCRSRSTCGGSASWTARAGPQQRAIAISNRNLGTNHGHVAWQRDRAAADRSGSARTRARCAVALVSDGARRRPDRDRGSALRRRARPAAARPATATDVSDEIEWATSASGCFAAGACRRDRRPHRGSSTTLRHVLAFDQRHEAGRTASGRTFTTATRSAFASRRSGRWRELGVPRARYFHNAVGLSPDEVIVLQREGTIEEIGAALRDAGADDGVILDNGGSVVCWVWWANDYRRRHRLADGGLPAAGHLGDRVRAEGAAERRPAGRQRVVQHGVSRPRSRGHAPRGSRQWGAFRRGWVIRRPVNLTGGQEDRRKIKMFFSCPLDHL